MSKKQHQIIIRNGKLSAIILDICEYKQLLERLEDLEDLKALRGMRKRVLKFRKLEDFLKEYQPRV